MKVTTIAIDLAKNVFQVHRMIADTKKVYNKRLSRNQLKELACLYCGCQKLNKNVITPLYFKPKKATLLNW